MQFPLTDPQPDFGRFEQALRRDGEPDRVPFVELMVDCEIMQTLLDEPVTRPQIGDRPAERHYVDQQIRFYHQFGYDYVPLRVDPGMPRKRQEATDTAELPHASRGWVDQTITLIGTWQEFEQYPWPQPGHTDFFTFEYAAQHLPPGMKITPRCSGVLEWSLWLMGYERFSYGLVDDPALIRAVVDAIGTHLLAIYNLLAELDEVGALWTADDMGHKTGTLVSPAVLRQYTLPWHKRIVAAIHRRGLPAILHSCGNLHEIMPDLIEDVSIDAKHSYEDTFLPAGEAKRRYGDRVAILGGVDMDMLSRAPEDELRRYVRRIIDECVPGGGYCLGSGNSIANYVKVNNYLAMLQEGWCYGRSSVG